MLRKLDRQTKVIWSFDGESLNDDLVDQVAQGRAECVRLIYNGAFAERIESFVAALRERPSASAMGVMIDVSSTVQATVAYIDEPVEYHYEESIVLAPGPLPEGKRGLSLKTDAWEGLFEVGSIVYLGYGNTVARVTACSGQIAEAQVIQGGVIQPRSEVHVPSTRKKPTLAPFKSEQLKRILRLEVDYLVLPGDLANEDMLELQNAIQTDFKRCPFLVAKVDSAGICNNLDSVLDVVDGLMISRRELALTTDPATVPMLTKEMLQLCAHRYKLSMVASEMLASMRFNPTPTRAEVSDVANAVLDGTDAVVLSEEVSQGRFGSKATQLLKRIILDVENESGAKPNWNRDEPVIETEFDAVAFQAYKTAQRIDAKAIVCITHSGNTPMRIASFGVDIPILAVTFSEHVLRRLCLVRGVSGLVLESDPHLDDVLPTVNDRLKRESWLSEDDHIVFVTITLSSLGREESNLFSVQKLK